MRGCYPEILVDSGKTQCILHTLQSSVTPFHAQRTRKREAASLENARPQLARVAEGHVFPSVWRASSSGSLRGLPLPRIGFGRGSLPASTRARRRMISIWALTDRRSSAAHLAIAPWTAGSSRRRSCLRLVSAPLPAAACPPFSGGTALPARLSLSDTDTLRVKGTRVDNWLRPLVRTQNDKQIRNHLGPAFVI